jgi:glycosyltransferase involved in cell wall biosynthesis
MPQMDPKPMRRVGLITYWYPPNRTVGTLRLAKFAKYLPDFGWEPVVYTVRPASDLYTRAGTLPDELRAGTVIRTTDPSLNVRVYRTVRRVLGAPAFPVSAPGQTGSRMLRLANWLYRRLFCFPDECWPWLLGYPALRARLASERLAAVVSSSPPVTTHLLAARLARDLGLPWVADLRDPWVSWPAGSHTRAHGGDRWIARRTLASASCLTSPSPPECAELSARHGVSVEHVPNGFDPDDLDRASRCAVTFDRRRWVVVHTGSIFPDGRDPTWFFEALTRLLAAGTLEPGDVQTVWCGRNLEIVARALRRYPHLAPAVELRGEVSYEESLAVQRAASALLLLEDPEPSARGRLPAKIYEYLAAGRPILARACRDGVVAALLGETGAGTVVTTVADAVPAMARLIDAWRRSRPAASVLPEVLARHTRRASTARLAWVLDRVVEGAGRGTGAARAPMAARV